MFIALCYVCFKIKFHVKLFTMSNINYNWGCNLECLSRKTIMETPHPPSPIITVLGDIISEFYVNFKSYFVNLYTNFIMWDSLTECFKLDCTISNIYPAVITLYELKVTMQIEVNNKDVTFLKSTYLKKNN